MVADAGTRANLTSPIGGVETSQVLVFSWSDQQRSALQRGILPGSDFGFRLGGEDEFAFVEQQLELGLRLGVAGQQQLAAVGRRDMQIDHRHGGELFDGAARRQAGRQGVEAPAERDVEAIGEEGDEDLRLDARLALVEDRPDGEVAVEVAERPLDADELEVQAPQPRRIVGGEIGAQ